MKKIVMIQNDYEDREFMKDAFTDLGLQQNIDSSMTWLISDEFRQYNC